MFLLVVVSPERRCLAISVGGYMLTDMYGAFLQGVRTSRQMTQAQVAANSGISQPNLSAYENDRRMPSLDVTNRILLACGYELVAEAGTSQIAAPLPDAQPLQGLDGDAPPVPEHRVPPRSLQQRGEAAWEVLELAEAFG